MNQKELPQNLKRYLNRFPDKAQNWSLATDEIKDICHIIRTAYNEIDLNLCEGDKGSIESLNFARFKTPSIWNSEAKKQIFEIWQKMSDRAKKQALKNIPFDLKSLPYATPEQNQIKKSYYNIVDGISGLTFVENIDTNVIKILETGADNLKNYLDQTYGNWD